MATTQHTQHTQSAQSTQPVIDLTGMAGANLLADLDFALTLAETQRAEVLTLRAKVQRALMLPSTATAADIKAALV